MGKILGWLFGRSPAIFDKDGSVRHNLGDAKWEAWKQRYNASAEYNWRNHSGMRAKEKKSPTSPSQSSQSSQSKT